MSNMSNLSIIDLGLIAYAEAWELQKRVVAARKASLMEDVLLFCEHPHVITQGRSGNRANLLAGENVLRQKGVEYFETTRGGDITYHGPGQIVGYPILNLGVIRRDVGIRDQRDTRTWQNWPVGRPARLRTKTRGHRRSH
jgi:lipoyl(octanoyl) transferase